MEDFLKDNFTLLNDGVIIVAAVVGLICYNKFRNTTAKYFIYFLIGAFFVDLIGGYPKYLSDIKLLSPLYDLIKDTILINNYWWFTLFWAVGSALFFSFYFQLILKNKLFIKILKYGSILLVFTVITHLAIDWRYFMTSFIAPIEIICFVIVILSALFYLIEVLSSEEILRFHKSIDFFIATTILIWWLITTPLMFYDMYFTSSDWTFVLLKYEVILLANLFMYLTFSIALLWCKPADNILLKD